VLRQVRSFGSCAPQFIFLRPTGRGFCWHQIAAKSLRRATNFLKLWLPLSEIILGVVQDLTCLVGMFKYRTNVPWHHWCIIEKIEETSAMSG
jgi:hypothetical protein